MEYTQWVQQETNSHQLCSSLNPCCNGIYSMRFSSVLYVKPIHRLNPCCNGIYSMRFVINANKQSIDVLILVVMEYTQWVRGFVAQEDGT